MDVPTDAETPLVSVVVCYHDNVDLTMRCLEKLRRNTPPHLYETILVDDGSGEPGHASFRQRDGVRYVRTDQNQGFTRSANLGARQARGRYLVFLNNDTEVQPGWLDAMLESAADGPDVGAVGAMLLYPDGTLQEAGSLIWSDGTGLNFGKGADRSDSAYRHRREVDYCSGACLLVRRHLFEEIGGFDESFSPGFYEDTDLCFSVRQRDLVVLYEPRALVLHREGATFGTESSSGTSTTFTKRSQSLNRHRFRAKWAEDLLNHNPPGTADGMRGGSRPDRPRVLVCDGGVPMPDRDSGSLRMAWLLTLLHEIGCEVTLYPLDRTERVPYAAWLRHAGIEVHLGPGGIEELSSARAGLFDLVILSRAEVSWQLREVVRRWFPRAVLVFDTVDLHFVREARRIALAGDVTRQERNAHLHARRVELDEVRAADLVSTVTDVEGAALAELVPSVRTVVLPNVHRRRTGAVPELRGRSGALFIGGYRHGPNADAVTWFVSEVLPLLSPPGQGDFVALGSDPTRELRALASESVRIPGHVDDVTEYFDRARVFVAPLRFGAGMKGKIGMAMAFGLPVVTTSVGAEGMGLVHGTHALVADEPSAFAESVLLLQTDDALWRKLSARGQELAEQWSPEAMRSRLSALVKLAVPADRLTARTWGRADPSRPFR